MASDFQQLNLDWFALAEAAVSSAEKKFGCATFLDAIILAEVVEFTERNLEANYSGFKPNVAKIAAVFSFWFRKLKPISFDPATKAHFLAINEMVALEIGLGLCERYLDDLSTPGFKGSQISDRLIFDWVHSLRAHSHSPNSTVIAFELVAANARESD